MSEGTGPSSTVATVRLATRRVRPATTLAATVHVRASLQAVEAEAGLTGGSSPVAAFQEYLRPVRVTQAAAMAVRPEVIIQRCFRDSDISIYFVVSLVYADPMPPVQTGARCGLHQDIPDP